MLVLFETAAGFALFKVKKEKKLKEIEKIQDEMDTAEKTAQILQLHDFQQFKDTTDALAAATGVIEGKLSKRLKKMFAKLVEENCQDEIAIADSKLGSIVKEKYGLQCVTGGAVQEIMRGIREHIDSLIADVDHKELSAMSLGLAHSLSRYKLKFSPDKIDTMIIQAISLLDDLDKELNNYVMRCREWYGWHFPEIGKVVADHLSFAKAIKLMGDRINASTTDFSDILPEDIEQQVKELAEISMGTEVSEDDIVNIRYLCDQIIEISHCREQLYEYLKNRMMAVAPNLTVLIGELVGARLISKAGSLVNLAKHPSSTIQILGAEKALFRALKTKHDTPKYGLIYHASLVGQSTAKNKGKISRMLAAKAALACRVDALGEGENITAELGIEHRAKVEERLRYLEEGKMKRISGTGKAQAKFDKYENKSEVHVYDQSADATIGKKRKHENGDAEEDEVTPAKTKKPKVEKTPKLEAVAEPEATTPSKKKKKKSLIEEIPAEEEAAPEEPTSDKKKKKKKVKAEMSE